LDLGHDCLLELDAEHGRFTVLQGRSGTF
ncbi:MAG: hypothetical protein ACI9ZF_002707, partial [Bradyrhizobium sp.]